MKRPAGQFSIVHAETATGITLAEDGSRQTSLPHIRIFHSLPEAEEACDTLLHTIPDTECWIYDHDGIAIKCVRGKTDHQTQQPDRTEQAHTDTRAKNACVPGPDCDGSREALAHRLASTGTGLSMELPDIMEFLLRSTAPNLPSKALAEVFDRLIWCLADNGKELLATRDIWLQSDDRQKVAIALDMDETLPLDGGLQLRTILHGIASRWPEFAKRCENISLLSTSSPDD